MIRRASAAACPRTAEQRFNILHLPAHLPSWPVARFLTQFEHGAQASGTVTSHITTDQVHRPQIKSRMNLQFTQAEGRATSRLTGTSFRRLYSSGHLFPALRTITRGCGSSRFRVYATSVAGLCASSRFRPVAWIALPGNTTPSVADIAEEPDWTGGGHRSRGHRTLPL